MLILGRLLLISGVLLLASCQRNIEMQAEKKVQTQKKMDATAYNIQLGMAYLKQGDIPRAKRKILTALELTPGSADVNDAMAYYLEKTGDINQAKSYYRKALALAPNNGAQLNNYGTFLCRNGDYQEAEKYFLKAVNDVQYVHTAGAYENAGLCASQIPDLSKAATYFIKALEHDSQRKQSLFELVNIELKLNDPQKALSYLQQYALLVKSDPILLNTAIEVAHKAGKAQIAAGYTQNLNSLVSSTDYTGVKNEYDSLNG